MTGWNMPPGCSPSDIPGWKDDDASVAFAEDFSEKWGHIFTKLYGEDTQERDDMENRVIDWCWTQIEKAWKVGWDEALAEEALIRHLKENDNGSQ